MKKKIINKRTKIKRNSMLKKIIIVAILLMIVLNLLRYAAYFKRESNDDISVLIQDNVNVELANEIYVDENDVVYFSEDDMKKYFDNELYYENDENGFRRYISVSQNKILNITENQNHVFINGVRQKIKAALIEKNSIYYFPISELETVYNIKVDYLKETKKVNIEKLSEEKKVAVVNRNTNLKYKMTNISKNVKELKQGESVTIVDEMKNSWVKIKTSDYMVGYIKRNKLTSIEKERNDLGKMDFSDLDLNSAVVINIDNQIYDDINGLISNYNDRKECISKIMERVNSEISKAEGKSVVVKVEFDNVNNAENYYRFLKELRAYLNDSGVCLIVKEQTNLDKDMLEKVVDIII